MATYCYSNRAGRVEDRVFPLGKAPDTVRFDDGSLALRDYAAEHRPSKAGSGWPMECVASGVNAEQAGELRELFRRHNCPTEVTRDGDPVYTSARHRKEALKIRGMYDRSAFC